jgi:hypothetical protein
MNETQSETTPTFFVDVWTVIEGQCNLQRNAIKAEYA